MVDANLVAAVVFGGCILGAFGRAMFPYLRKLKEEEDVEAETAKGLIKRKGSQVPEKVSVFNYFLGYSFFICRNDSLSNISRQCNKFTSTGD